MAAGDKESTTTSSQTTKAYFLADGSYADELIVGKEASLFKDNGYSEPVELTEEEVKAAQAKGIKLSEAKS
jgi:hypothetical protein